jgi:hypothetical protein
MADWCYGSSLSSETEGHGFDSLKAHFFLVFENSLFLNLLGSEGSEGLLCCKPKNIQIGGYFT